MNHPHPWRISDGPELPEWLSSTEYGEVEVVDAADKFICWAYREEAEAIVAASEAVVLLRDIVSTSDRLKTDPWSELEAIEGLVAKQMFAARALLARIDDEG